MSNDTSDGTLCIGATVDGTPFTMPIDAVTQTFGIVAKRSSGKTYTASVFAEELLRVGQRLCVVDPTGVWWGLRASADGEAPGFPVVVFGGEHADIPLVSTMGVQLAELFATEHLSSILDLSLFSQHEKHRFVGDFAETLYRRNRLPLQLILDEADEFAPQVSMHEERRMLGAVDRLVRRGRVRGLGVTLITQRPAVVHKNVLSQIEVLVAMRLTSAQDRKAVEAWINAQGDDQQKQKVMGSLPGLPIGEAWIWSPGWLGVLEHVKIRQRITFDSSATPKVGETVRTPNQLAAVDIGALRERLQVVDEVEEKSTADVAAYKTRILELEQQLAATAKTKSQQVGFVVVEDHLVRLETAVRDLSGIAERIQQSAETLANAITQARSVAAPAPVPTRPAQAPRSPPTKPAAKRVVQRTAPQQRILNTLAAFDRIGMKQVARPNIAVWAEQSPKSSGFTNNLGALRSAGLIDYPKPGFVVLTEAGRAVAEPTPVITTLRQLHSAWLRRLPNPQAILLRTLIGAHPTVLTRDMLADIANVSPTSSGYTNNLGALRSLGLIDYPRAGSVVATSLLFPKGLQ